MFGWVTPFWTWLGLYEAPEITELATCGKVFVYRTSGFVSQSAGAQGALIIQPGVRGRSDAGCRCCDA